MKKIHILAIWFRRQLLKVFSDYWSISFFFQVRSLVPNYGNPPTFFKACTHFTALTVVCGSLLKKEEFWVMVWWWKNDEERSWITGGTISLTIYYITKWWYYDIMRFFQTDSTSSHAGTSWCCQPEKNLMIS